MRVDVGNPLSGTAFDFLTSQVSSHLRMATTMKLVLLACVLVPVRGFGGGIWETDHTCSCA